MAPHSSTLALKIPWAEEPSRLSDTTEWLHFHFSLFMHWRRKWQPTPVFLPGESQGWGNLVGFHLWGCTESDTTEVTAVAYTCFFFTSLVAQMVKASACNAGNTGSIPGSRRSPGEGNGNPLQYSCLENPMDGGTNLTVCENKPVMSI